MIPFSMPAALGRLVGDRRQGLLVLAVMGGLWLATVAPVTWAEAVGAGAAPEAAGAALEGKEVRFGKVLSALFAASTTGTSTGAVDACHDSFTAPGGGVVLLDMPLGESPPAASARASPACSSPRSSPSSSPASWSGARPSCSARRSGPPQVVLVALYVLTMPALVLVGAALPRTSSPR